MKNKMKKSKEEMLAELKEVPDWAKPVEVGAMKESHSIEELLNNIFEAIKEAEKKNESKNVQK